MRNIQSKIQITDSAVIWYEKAKKKELSHKKKLLMLEKAKAALSSSHNDTIHALILQSSSSIYSKLKDYNNAINETLGLLELAEQKSDSSLIAKSNFKLGYYYSKKNNNVSAYKFYRNALEFFINQKDSLTSSQLLGNIASIQNKIGDFTGAQKSAIKAIEFQQKEDNKKLLYKLYNNFANACQNNLQFDEAAKAYQSTYTYASSFYEKTACKNNIALNYKKQKAHKKALAIFEELVSCIELDEYPSLKARILDNYGFSLFQTNQKGALALLIKARKIRISENDTRGLLASNIHLVQYYLKSNKGKALAFAKVAIDIADELKNIDTKLEALKFIIELEDNPKDIALTYNRLSDSIQTAKKTEQNRYAATLFQTKEKERENQQLKADKIEQERLTENAIDQRRKLALGLMTSLLVLGVIIYFFQKNKKQKVLIENLQKELHHRVKNNLSIIDTFIEVAKEEFDDTKFETILTELQHRINSINEVHRHLHKNKDVTSLNIKDYIDTLVEHIKLSINNSEVKVHTNIDGNLKFKADTSFSIGLIINEFITNSFKHGFTDNDGEIQISIKENKQNYILSISDNGKGLPPNFNISKTESFGMRMMYLLAKQLNGTFQLTNNQGVQIKIAFQKTIL